MVNDTDDKKTYGLLGRNISYSLSPVMHNSAFEHFGIPAEYKLFDIEEDQLTGFVTDDVLGGKLSGFNVTVPYKIRIRELLENCSLLEVRKHSWVNVIGSVNTVKVEGASVLLDNTDARGFHHSLKSDAGFDLKGKKVFVAGAGGAGRVLAIYMVTLQEDLPEFVRVYDVDKGRLKELVDIYEKCLSSGFTVAGLETASSPEEAKGCDLIVNATPLGTKESDPSPVPLDILEEGMSVYDLVYARETELVKSAREKGLTASGGLGMLVGQAAAAFSIWTGRDIEEARPVMMKAALEKLGKQ
jgi:shikimate dehydrogenase